MAVKVRAGLPFDVLGAAGLIAATCACGEPADASLPVDLGDLGGEVELPRAEAVLALQVRGVTDDSECAVSFSVELPDAMAPAALASTTGAGERLVDGASARGQRANIQCRVTAMDQEAGPFDVSMTLSAGLGGSFEATGHLHAGPSQLLAVRVSGGGHSLAQEDCEVDVDTILPGAVWLRAIRCSELSSEAEGICDPASECKLVGAAIFEKCAP